MDGGKLVQPFMRVEAVKARVQTTFSIQHPESMATPTSIDSGWER